MKTIHRKYGRDHRAMVDMMHFFHQPGQVHDSVDEVKMNFVPKGEDHEAKQNIGQALRSWMNDLDAD